MGYFPFYVEIEKKKCVIAGGGAVAFRKAQDLLPFGVFIEVISTEISGEFKTLASSGEAAGRLSLSERPFSLDDMGDADFVIAATGDAAWNHRIAEACKERKIPVNVTDDGRLGSFYFPSIVRDGSVVVGISTGGESPALAALLKKRIQAALPPGTGRLAAQLKALREKAKAIFPDSQRERGALLRELAQKGMENHCDLT
jgi:uroporphyrin-III C-methyltransferase/precorrin-2 dehydrogenase/sirohydrochlorin ferrochelatase/precorrin-2 dehydrogenase/sirohydrochlorin ferrochelatase